MACLRGADGTLILFYLDTLIKDCVNVVCRCNLDIWISEVESPAREGITPEKGTLSINKVNTSLPLQLTPNCEKVFSWDENIVTSHRIDQSLNIGRVL